MTEIWAGLFLILLFLCLTLNIFSLPGNWALLALAAAWKFFHPEMADGWGFFILLGGLATIGEIIQFISQTWGVKKYGGSRRANLWSIIGSIGGAILGAPILFGLGAIPGAFAGAYAGGLLAELAFGRPFNYAHRAAMGAFLGSVLGLVSKFGIGVFMFVLSARVIWPG